MQVKVEMWIISKIVRRNCTRQILGGKATRAMVLKFGHKLESPRRL
jgi:hypothetical protein